MCDSCGVCVCVCVILTPHVVVSAVHHVGGVDELVTGASHAQLNLSVTQHHFTPAQKNSTDTLKSLRTDC